MTVRLIESPPFFVAAIPPFQAKSSLQKLFSFLFSHREIDSFADSSINLKHIKATNLSINLQDVPDSIQIEQLRDMFQDINFEKPHEPGYMPPSTRKEEDFTYSRDLLLWSLNQFLMSMHEKTAFTGTPKANTHELSLFFTHIENVVRFSIYKVNKNYDDFMKVQERIPRDPTDPAYKTHEDLLQAKARLVIDLALTGCNCGGRFMSTSIELYQMLGKSENRDGSLQSLLFNTLANLREQIANSQIEKLINSLDSSLQQEHTAHAISSYMAKLGPLLGLPGTENCVENSRLIPVSKSRMLRDFFQIYTPNLIENEIQKEIKNSELLREAVIDWIRDQVGTWKEQEYNEITKELHQEILQIKTAPLSDLLKNVRLWEELLTHLHSVNTSLPINDSWQILVVETLSLDASKSFFKEKHLDIHARMQLQKDLTHPIMETAYKESRYPPELDQRIILLDKVKTINKTIRTKGFQSIAEETLFRCLEGKSDLEKALKNHLNKERQGEFLTILQPFIKESPSEKVPEYLLPVEGLRPDVLHWILTASEITYD